VLDGPRRTGDGYYESAVLDPDGNRLERHGGLTPAPLSLSHAKEGLPMCITCDPHQQVDDLAVTTGPAGGEAESA
jgi:hypothetical protein